MMFRLVLALARSRRVASGGVLAVLLALTSCGVEDSLPLPYCSVSGSGVLVAQSVPSATQIPCFDALPRGWSTSAVEIDEERAVITLDSDRAGDDAAVLWFEATCDVADAVRSPSEWPVATRHDLIEQLAPGFQAKRFYQFDGGCVTWFFEFEDDASASDAIAIGESLDLIARDDLNQFLRDDFIDREL